MLKLELCGGTMSALITNRINPIYAAKGKQFFTDTTPLRMWGTIIEIFQKTFLIAPFCREFSTEFFKA
jgi:hypothetical protein